MANALSSKFLEGAVFHSYHALESLACAALSSAGHNPPRSHVKKLGMFVRLFGHRFPQFANLAYTLEPLRNKALYPSQAAGEWAPPQAAVSPAGGSLARRTAGLVHRVIQEMRL
jgi:HEPN domain-containing protein